MKERMRKKREQSASTNLHILQNERKEVFRLFIVQELPSHRNFRRKKKGKNTIFPLANERHIENANDA
tara:strand:+ start:912 stop:1115 length:204 start_codon:yes stop_codon:yes gene_type:complete